MIHDFLALPTFVMCSITIILSSGFSIIALYLIRRKLNWESFRENHEVGGFLFNALGLIYAVLIAFVVYATWNDYNAAQDYCDREANMMHDLFLDSEGLPQKQQLMIKEMVLDYLKKVIQEDWPLLGIDQANPRSREVLLDLWRVYQSIDNFDNEREKVMYSESLTKLNDVTDYRRLRILSSQNHIPAVVWTVIILGALTSIGFALFFGTRSFTVQATMTSLFAMTNAVIFLLILALDHPFLGDVKITTLPYENILTYLHEYIMR